MSADSHERTYGLTRFRAITPGTGDLAVSGVYPRGISATVAGTIDVVGVDDTTAVTVPIAAGVFQPICAKKITAATATGIVAGY